MRLKDLFSIYYFFWLCRLDRADKCLGKIVMVLLIMMITMMKMVFWMMVVTIMTIEMMKGEKIKRNYGKSLKVQEVKRTRPMI